MGLEHSQGVTFSFSNATYTATSISVQRSRGEIDATTVDMPAGAFRRFRSNKFPEVVINMEWLGMTKPDIGKTASFSLSGLADWTSETNQAVIAVCSNYSVNAQAGDIIRCSGTFKISNE